MLKNIFAATYDNDVERIKELLRKNSNNLNARFKDDSFPLAGVAAWVALAAKKILGSGLFVLTVGAILVETGGTAAVAGASFGGAGAAAWNVGDQKLIYYTRDRRNWTPLHFAASGNALEAALLLIREGADVNKKDCLGRTFIQIAQTRVTHLAERKKFIKECQEEIQRRAAQLRLVNDLQNSNNQNRQLTAELNIEREVRQQLAEELTVAAEELTGFKGQLSAMESTVAYQRRALEQFWIYAQSNSSENSAPPADEKEFDLTPSS